MKKDVRIGHYARMERSLERPEKIIYFLGKAKGVPMKSKHTFSKVAAAGTACVLLALACSFLNSPGDPAQLLDAPVDTPVAEPPARASNTPGPADTVEAEAPSCYKWNEITLDMAGEVVCVYGVAFSHQGQSRIDFSPEKNTFFLIDGNYYYPNLSEGSCIVAEQKVEIFDGKIPFMTINGDLFECEPWMLE
jgi:hypothetical protein